MPRIVVIFLALLSFLCGNAFGYARSHPLASPAAKATYSTNQAALITDHCLLTTSFDFGWDAKNQLVRARTKNHSSAAHAYDLTFTHDAEGRRVQKHVVEYQHGAVVSEKFITFVWDGWDLLYERQQLPSGLTTIERKYLWGPDIADGAAGGAGGLLLIQETKGNNTQKIIPLYDGTGHVTALTNLNKDLLASYAYGPFGEKITATGPMANSNPWRWATKYFDEETGLYYFGKRYLDPVTGQWLSRELLGESESLNLYSYCHNDPVNRVDVLGLEERVVTDSNPEIFGTDKEGDGLYFGWPTEEDGLFRGFESTGRFYYQGPFPASQIKEYISSRERLSLLRDRASLAFKSEGLTQSIQKLQVAQFYTANIAQAAVGVGEATVGIIAEPFTFGVSTVAVVHGADVTGTAVLRSLHGPEIDVQSSTSLAFQFVGFNRKTAEFGDASLSFVVPAAQLTQGASSLLARRVVLVGGANSGGLVPSLEGNIPDPAKWIMNGGRVTFHPDGAMTFVTNESVSVKYSATGYPNFSGAGLVRQQVKFPFKGNYTTDFTQANKLAPLGPKLPTSTWHHVEDLNTMQEIDRVTHSQFYHSGGVSIINGN